MNAHPVRKTILMQSAVATIPAVNNEVKQIKILHLFIFFTVCYWVLYWYNFNYIARDELFYNSLAEQLTVNRVRHILELNKKFRWMSYAGVPVFLYLKWLLVATCLYIRLFFQHIQIEFASTIKMAAVAELALVLTGIIKMALLSFFVSPETLEQLQNFTPLSVYSLVKNGPVPVFFVYLLQSLNLFELAYILLIAWSVKEISAVKFNKALYYTLTSYGIGLLFWVILVVFLQQYFV